MDQVVGIDVSAKTLDVSWQLLKEAPAHAVFENSPEGFKKIVDKLTKKGRSARVVLEATGVYHFDLARALHKADRIELMVANPKATKAFAVACMTRGKTDKVDSNSLMEFARRMDFVPWVPPTEPVVQLNAIARRILAVTEDAAAEKNRLHAVSQTEQTPKILKLDILKSIAQKEERVAGLQEAAIEIIHQDPALCEKYDLLLSVTGIGETSAVRILGEVALLPSDMTARQWVAHAGLDPRPKQSGTSVHGKTIISKAGNARLRQALYFPALSAMRFQENVKAFYEKLLGKGKVKMQAIVAVMRKLLHAIWGMFHHHAKFDGKKFYAEAAPLNKNAGNVLAE